MELDSLEIKIQATATKANNAIDNMITRLEKLSGTLNGINGTSLSGLANGVNRLAAAMQTMKNVGTADFTRLAKNITKLGSINTVSLNNTASSLSHITRAFSFGNSDRTIWIDKVAFLYFKQALFNIPLHRHIVRTAGLNQIPISSQPIK